MHTRTETGVNVELVEELKKGFTWEPPFPTDTNDDNLAGPEDITLDDIDKSFDELDKQLRAEKAAAATAGIFDDVDGSEILEGKVYDLTELDVIDKGLAPMNAVEDLSIIGEGEGMAWDSEVMMRAKGIM